MGRLIVGLLALVGFGLLGQHEPTPAGATTVPIPLYDVQVLADGRPTTLLGLPLTAVGLPLIPTPVDVDGDLLPDVLVSLNLIDTGAVAGLPATLFDLVAPNLTVDRLPTAGLLGAPEPAVRLTVGVRTVVLETGRPGPSVRFGYDAPVLPERFRAVVGGLARGFRPLTFRLGSGPLLAPTPASHEGPLAVVAELTGPLEASLRFDFLPLPRLTTVSYRQDGATSTIHYEHDASGPVDIAARLVGTAPVPFELEGRIDRVPRRVDLTVEAGGPSGRVIYVADGTGPAPDLRVDAKAVLGGKPIVASADVAAVPPAMSATWRLGTGVPAITFDAPGAPIGSVDVELRDHDPIDPELAARVPGTRQHLTFLQRRAGADIRTRVTGRIEQVGHASFSMDGGTLVADAQLGDGGQPLSVTASLLDLAGFDIAADAVITPLPARFGVRVEGLAGATTGSAPLLARYTASSPVDVDLRAEVTEAGQPAACGTRRHTLCAEVEVDRVPTMIETRIAMHRPCPGPTTCVGSTVEIDTASSAAPPDIRAHAVAGPIPGLPVPLDGRPLVADLGLSGLPAWARVGVVSGPAGFERLEVRACQADVLAEEPVCVPGTRSRLGGVEARLANFLATPADLHAPTVSAPLSASLVARGRPGSDMDAVAEARLADVDAASVRLSTGGVQVDTRIGGGRDLAVALDARGLDGAADGSLDLVADAVVSPLPPDMAVCVRLPGSVPTVSMLDSCATPKPFAGIPGETDLDAIGDRISIGYRGGTVHGRARVRLTERGPRADRVTDDLELVADVDVSDVPASFAAHVDVPRGVKQALRARYVAGPGPQPSVRAAVSARAGGVLCGDPRPPGPGGLAVCGKVELEHLPASAFVRFAPADSRNLRIVTSGEQPVRVPMFELTAIGLSAAAELVTLQARGSVQALPRGLVGSLSTSANGPAFDVAADPVTSPLQGVDLVVRNGAGPDVLPAALPQRSGLPVPTEQVALVARGSRFRGEAHLREVRRAAVVVGEHGSVRIGLGFGTGAIVRGFVDAELTGSPPVRVLGDATVTDVPEQLDIDIVPPGAGVHGRFEILSNHSGSARADVFALVRVAVPGLLPLPGTPFASDVLSGQVAILNVPHVLRGTIGDGRVDFAGFEADGTTPDGIDRVDVEVADFDLPADYPVPIAPVTGERRPATLPPLPPAPDAAHAFLVATGGAFHARLRLGEIEGGGRPGVGLQRFSLRPGTCAPLGAVGPRYPLGDVNARTCVEGIFERTPAVPGGPSAAAPLYLHAVADIGGLRVALLDGGLTDVPDRFAFTLARAPVTGPPPARAILPACPTTDRPAVPGCVPPLVHLETDRDAVAFGTFQVGETRALDRMATEAVPRPDAGPTVDLREAPTAEGFGSWGPAATGVRAVLATSASTSVPAVRIGFRLAVPRSFTLDAVRTWTASSAGFTATDVHLHAVVRDAVGAAVPTLGEAAALVLGLDDGQQLLVTGEQAMRGAPIPGEVGLDLYLRGNPAPEDRRIFVQVDGRLSAPLTARVMLLRGSEGPAAMPPRVEAFLRNAPAADGPDPATPGFRVQLEMTPPPPPDGQGAGCTVLMCLRNVRVALGPVAATVDLQPQGQAPVRLARLAYSMRSPTELDLEVRAYADVAGTRAAELTIEAMLRIEQLRLTLEVGLPFVGGVSLDLDVSIDLVARLERVSRARITGNVVHYSVASTSSSGGGVTLEGALQARTLTGQLHGLLLPLLGFSGIGDIPVRFNDCASARVDPSPRFFPGNTFSHFLLWPLEPGDVQYFGFLAPIAPALLVMADIACNVLNLTTTPLVDDDTPGNPVLLVTPEHPVPGTASVATPPNRGRLEVAADQEVPLCGEQELDELIVHVSGRVVIGQRPGPHCPAGSEGRLVLVVNGNAEVDGFIGSTASVQAIDIRVLGDLRIAGPLSVVAGRVRIGARALTVESGGRLDLAWTGAAAAGTDNVPVDVAADTITVAAGGRLSLESRVQDAVRLAATALRDVTIDGEVRADDDGGADTWIEAGRDLVIGSTGSVTGGGFAHVDFDYMRLLAGRTLRVEGRVANDGVVRAQSGIGNAGGENGGYGGAGSDQLRRTPASPAVSADRRFDGRIAVFPGRAGSLAGAGPDAGPTNGGGGGVLNLTAPEIEIAGTVSVNGAAGLADCAGDAKRGGGSGGTIVIDGHRIAVSSQAQVQARGGDGGAGAGGGGGGQVLVTAGSIPAGAWADLSPGQAGPACGRFSGMEPGGPGNFVRGQSERSSRVIAVGEGFHPQETPSWTRGNRLSATVDIVSPDEAAVIICGHHVTFEAASGGGVTGGIPWPPPDRGPFNLGCAPGDVEIAPRFSASAGETFVSLLSTDLAEGYWAVYSVAGPLSMDFPEMIPTMPDVILRVERREPQPVVRVPALTNRPSGLIDMTIEPVIDLISSPAGAVEASGVVDLRCALDTVPLSCEEGDNVVALGSDGEHVLTVIATDKAGNIGGAEHKITVDTVAPSAVGVLEPGPDGRNGWYVTGSPSLRLDGYADATSGAPQGAGAIVYEMRVDGGAAQTCAQVACTMPVVAGDGAHVVQWRAFDAAGNATAWHDLTLRVDRQAPVSSVVAAPPPDGANGWFVTAPIVAVDGFDHAGGSGFVPVPGSGDDGSQAGVFSRVDGIVEQNRPPFVAAPGSTLVCHFAADMAGAQSVGGCESIGPVDLADPTVTIEVAPSTPLGADNWYLGPTSMTFGASDPGGSGVDSSFDPDLTGLCDGTARPDPRMPSGICASVDGAPFVAVTGPLVLGEGRHRVAAFAVDVAGRRGPVAERQVKVDLSAPGTAATVSPPPPGVGWQRTRPVVRLVASDSWSASGVARVERRLDGGAWLPVNGSVVMPVGEHVLEHRAVDRAGRTGPVSAATVRYDPAGPVVQPLGPNPAVLVRLSLLRLLGSLLPAPTAALTWRLTETTGGPVRVAVLVYDVFGQVVRRLDGGVVPTLPGLPATGSVAWDGFGTGLALLPLGLYHYRIVATDAAGNVSESVASRPIQLVAG